MRAVLPSLKENTTMLGGYLSNMSEAMAVRRANAEAKRAKLEAELSIKARSEFLSNMNHELRTPLNAIIGFATMLKSDQEYDLSAEKRSEYSQYILQSADLLLGHINTILEVAALDGGEIEIEKGNIDLAELLSAVVKQADVSAEAGHIAVENRSEAGAVHVWADEAKVARAVDHLLRLAIKLSPKQGKVLVRTVETEDGWGEIAIKDSSNGLDKEDLGRALNAFGDVNRGLDQSFSGPGVDLAIAKSFVELQGGKFSIRSKAGAGTIVRVAFPPPQQEQDKGQAEQRDTLAMTG